MIRILTSPDCPMCHEAIQILVAARADYVEVDTGTVDGMAEAMLLVTGERGLPLVIDGDTRASGSNAVEYLRTLFTTEGAEVHGEAEQSEQSGHGESESDP